MGIRTPCAVAAMAVPSFGGKLIEMDSTDLSNNQTTLRKMMLDNERLAIVDGRSKIIFRADGGRMRIQVVDLQRNEYMEIDEATMKQLADTMPGASAQMEAAMKGVRAGVEPHKRDRQSLLYWGFAGGSLCHA